MRHKIPPDLYLMCKMRGESAIHGKFNVGRRK